MVVLQMSVFPVNITHQLFPMHGTKFVAKRPAANYMTHSGLSLDYPLLMTQACQLERFPVDSQLSQFLSLTTTDEVCMHGELSSVLPVVHLPHRKCRTAFFTIPVYFTALMFTVQ